MTTGSNMKNRINDPGSSPHGYPFRENVMRWALAVLVSIAPLAFMQGQVSITCPPTLTISCSMPPIPANTGSATATTNCATSSVVTLSYADNMGQMNGCMGTGTIRRTWTATDACGMSATCMQNIIVEDNTSPTLSCPPFMIISCQSDTTPATLGFAVATDDCTPDNLIEYSYTDDTHNLTQCNGTGSFTRHWQAEDMCGNVAACIQTIVIIDNEAPVLQVPASVTLSCEETPSVENTGMATAIDNCTSVDQVIITFSDNVFGLTGCSGTGTIVRTWSAKDACNNISTGTQFITLEDTTPPAYTCPANITISCESSILPAVTGTFTATDLCGSVFTGYTDQIIQQVCNGTGLIERHWNAIDGCGNISGCIQSITIIDQTLPVISCPVEITVDCAAGIGTAVTGVPVVSDNCTSIQALIVTYSDIEIVPLGCNNTGTLERTFIVSDACGNSASCSQLIHITDLLKPTLTCPPPATISCESSVLPDVTGEATASDNCTSQQDIIIAYSDDVSLLFGCNGTGILKRTWSATDLCGNVSTCLQQIWIVDDTDPVITCPANVEISCSDSIDPSATGYATATDNCTAVVDISYIDHAQLNDCNQTGLILRVWSASDACGNVKTCTQLITIVDHTAPVLVCPRDTIIDCGFYNNPDALGYPTGTDNCTPSDELVLGFSDNLSGLTGCTNTGVILRTWTMTDACGNIGSCVQTITVADTTAPVIVCPPNVVIGCQDPTTPQYHGKATATDYCTASLLIKITYVDDLSQTGNCNGSGFIYRNWSAEDQCGNIAVCTQVIQIVDDEAPVIQCPSSYAISCEVDRSPDTQGWALATDNCTPAGMISITYDDDISNLTGCNGTGNLVRTWTAKDACGNTSSCVQTITITDTKAPVVIPPPAITVSCESSLDVSVTGQINATDNCTPFSSLDIQILNDEAGVVGCNHTGTLIRTWIVTDLCGNSKKATQTIQIIDATKPTIVCGSSLTVNCGESVDPSDLGIPEISDNCTAVPDMDLLHFDNTAGLNGCNGTGTLFRTWVVYDDCGNSNSCLQTINVVDQIAPVITLPANLTISCEYSDDMGQLGVATAVDACTPVNAIVINYKDDDTGLSLCNNTGQRARIWEATDLCGNKSTATQYIRFIDTLGPIFYTPLDLQIQCDDNPLDFELTGFVEVYTDNCAPESNVIISFHDDMAATQNCDDDPIIQRIWTLTDPCGNSTSSVQHIKVMNYSMSQVQFPADAYIPCDADMMDLSLTGSVIVPENACSYLMDTMYAEELGEILPYQFGRKWVCIDYCGHVEEHVQMIYLIDSVKPTLKVQDIDVSFANGEVINITPDMVIVEVEDNCDQDVSIALSQVELTCEDFMSNNEVLIEITATDDQGNVTVEQIIVTLVGGLFIMDCPDDIITYVGPGECGAQVNYTMSPQGLCGQEPIISQLDGTGLVDGAFFPVGVTELVFMVSDQLGYSEECSFTVEVVEYPGTTEVACQDTLHVSVALQCEALITADMLLEGSNYGCYDHYVIEFSDPAVQYQNGILFAYPHIGKYLEACITDPESGNFCCSQLLIEDKLPPELFCSDITLECSVDTRPESIDHFPVADASIVTPIGNNKYLVTGIDNCGPTTIRYSDVEDVHMCDGVYSNIITRYWSALDPSGRTANCQEKLYLVRETIDQYVLPGDTTIYCGNACIRPDGTPDPNCIGGIEGPFCGTFFKGYIDKVIPYCGGSYSVKREWSLVDWCNSANIIQHVQIINIEDNVPPVIDCQAVIDAPSDFGDCGAEVKLTPPPAYDACGSEPLIYTLKLNGQVIHPVNGEYSLPALGIGQYAITWEVRDDCGNLATCNTTINLYDSTPPTAYCDAHTTIAINNQDPMGVALLPATTLDDGSFDNCGPVTFRARRLTSCINFDWTTDGINHEPDGLINTYDQGLVFREYVPVSCCDAGEDYIFVELEVMDLQGNVNYCMVEVEVQDKVAPKVTCPPDVQVSCDFWFDPYLLEDLSNRLFGTVVDGFMFDQSERQPIIINDPSNPNFSQPHNWGIDGYVTDNCNLDLDVQVRVYDDCSGDDLPGNPPPGAVKLVQRRFIATDPAGRVGTCTQNIWVVNFDPFYINNDNPNDPNDDIIWPADIEVNHCGIPDTIPPIILNDGCAQIGVNLKERVFNHIDGACVKILRDWTILDWCQYNAETGAGIWRHTQIVKVTDSAGALFTECNNDIQTYCTLDDEVTEVIDPAFETTCFVHLNIKKHIEDICSETIKYDVKIYPPNSTQPIIAVGNTFVAMNPDGTFDLVMNTALSPDLTLRNYGLEYSDRFDPNAHYKVLWSVQDGCGGLTTCEDRIRLEDCKKPTPVCINGLSTVPMPSSGSVTIWAKDFNASSYDNCTMKNQLRYSFSGTSYQPSMVFTCDDILASGVQIPLDIYVWDNWGNNDYCATTIVFTDPTGVCGLPSTGITGEVHTPNLQGDPVKNVSISLMYSGNVFGSWTTTETGTFNFPVVPAGQMYTLKAERNDNHKNGVSTLDLIRLQEHLLGKSALNDPYLLIAADANNSMSVSALDLIEIRKLIIGQYAAFPNVTSWVFIPSSYVFPDPYHPWPFEQEATFMVNTQTIENFMGVKIGDLNATAKANIDGLQPRSESTAAFYAVNRHVNEGEEFVTDIALSDFEEGLLGGQWEIALKDAELISVEGLATDLVSDMWFVDHSSIRFAWTPKEAVKTDKIVRLKLLAKKSGMISELMDISHDFMHSEIYDTHKEPYTLSLEWRALEEEIGVDQVQLHQNTPNPWDNETVIPFEIGESGIVSLNITNALGVEMTTITQEFAAGKQQFEIKNNSWPQGLYYYTIRFGDTQLTKTMLILNKH